MSDDTLLEKAFGGTGSSELTESDRAVAIWKMKKLIKGLEEARGNGTSMISLIIPPKDQLSRITRMLAEEYGTASNIKSRVNRLSVLSAITSTQQRLKLYNRVPPNGLVVYCGTVVTEDNKEKKFHTEALSSLMESEERFGFIIIDGGGALFGVVSGSTREILHKFTIELPKKHGRGGQSALRFARLRLEKRRNFLRRSAETAAQLFIPDGQRVNVTGLVLAGSADFKNELNQSDLFDQRLHEKVIKIVDVSYGGENGFNQAIELAAEALSNVKFVQEKKLIQSYFDEISQDTGKVVYGVKDTLKALEMGAVEKLIVWENLEHTRLLFKNPQTGEESVQILTTEQLKDSRFFKDSSTGIELDVVDQQPLVDWLADNYKNYGASLDFVSNRSQEGSQFVRGFGGIGGLLRYVLDVSVLEEPEDEADELDDDWEL
ncbi:Eukaryotic peptide chain release factor subunit 1 [Galdieria sulphuraria]|nr:Eukaryotic peptide chain release factor subunit 1 [Galdieria sulphuraria]